MAWLIAYWVGYLTGLTSEASMIVVTPPQDPHPTPHPPLYISVPHKEILIFTIPSHKKEVPNLFYPPPI